MRNIQTFFILLLIQIHFILMTLGKFMIKTRKEILTPNNLNDVYQTNLQHEMVF